MGAPLISVITPVYNAGVFLRPAVESILTQTLPDFELWLVDDGSTDGSREELSRFADPRVRVLLNEKNLGVATTRNRALAEVRGEFIAFLNHDDVAHPQRFARQVEFLRANPAIMLVGSGIATFDGDGKQLPATTLPCDSIGIRWGGLLECPLRQSAMMLRDDFVRRHQLRYDPDYFAHSDYAFVMQAVRLGSAANLPEVLVHYRRHAGSLSKWGYTRLVADGNRIAHGAIAAELPDFKITLEQTALVRSVVLSYVTATTRRSLAATKEGWKLYLDLFEAFREKHGASAGIVPRQPVAP